MKKIIATSVLIVTLLMCQVANATFSDVDQTTDYQNAITWMADNGVIQGYPDGTFMPDQCVNRAEFLKMMYLTSKKDIVITDSASGSNYYDEYFSDTDTEEWYWPYVNKALHDGTVEGYPDGTFRPDQCVKRVEAIKMAVLEFNNGEIPDYEEILLWGFEDVDRSAWYGEFVEAAFSQEVIGMEHVDITSVESGKFYPGDSMSRKEVAEMLYRMKTVKDNALSVYDGNSTPMSLNFYVSPSSGVSFMMTDMWEVTSDDYYETPGGAVADYPTIQIQGPDEEIVAINFPMMQCEGELAGQCFELAEGYTLGAGDPSTEALYLINRMLLTFRVPEQTPSESIISIDDTWNKYTNDYFGFSINIPKNVEVYNCDSDKETYPLVVSSDNESVYFAPEYSYKYDDQGCTKVKNDISMTTPPTPWKLNFRNITDESELDTFVKDVFLPGCSVNALDETDQSGVFDVSLNTTDFDAEPNCFLNWAAVIKYYPDGNKAVQWDIGQDTNFYYDGDSYDLDMVNSFRFE